MQMEGNTTIEEKPATLYLHTARPPSRASTPHPPDQIGFPGPYTMAPGMYGYPQGPVTMPMWGYPGMPPPGLFWTRNTAANDDELKSLDTDHVHVHIRTIR